MFQPKILHRPVSIAFTHNIGRFFEAGRLRPRAKHETQSNVGCYQSMLALIANFAIMNSNHRKTLEAIFARPTSPSIVFTDIESLIMALGGSVTQREGSRVKMVLRGEQWRCHRPHPGKEAKRYQVEEVRELLQYLGIRP